jgi:hypothetical protein
LVFDRKTLQFVTSSGEFWFKGADEILSTGNYIIVAPASRIDDRTLEPGPFYRKA